MAARRRAGGAVAHQPGFAAERHSEGTMKSKQSGITLIGFLFVLAIAAFFGYMAMKLVPSYIEFMGVSKAMTQVASDGAEGKTLDSLRRDLMYKMDMQYVDNATITPKDITIKRSGNGAQLNIAYDKRVAFLYNIDFLLHFENSVMLRGNVGD
jgi:Tfp pilus assembly major pilin PilA